MALPSVVVLQQLARARLRQALLSVISAVVLLVVALTAVGLAVAAGVIASAQRFGTVEALLLWSAGLLLAAMLLVMLRMLVRRRRRVRELARAASAPIGSPGATLMSDLGLRAGMNAAALLSPPGALPAALVTGAGIARTRRRCAPPK